MSTPEVNTVGPVGGSALSKDPLSVCKVCFNLDPELIPPDVGISRDLESENRRAVKLISRTGDEMRASAARGCISCSVLLEGVSIHCSVLCNDVNWNPRERLKEVKLLFNLKFTLILQPIFTSTTLDKLGAPRERDNLECALEFYTKNGLALYSSNKGS
jgi:predicted nucleic acid-binding Zn ribbon protein